MPENHLRLDEDTHTYWIGSRRVPGYSEMCASMQVGVEDCELCAKKESHTHNAAFYTDDGKEQGKALHQWLLFLASGKFTTIEPEPEIAGRVNAIKKFLRESGFEFEGGETPLYESRLGFAVTPDLWGRIGRRRVVIDAKRGAKLKIHSLQTAAQKIALTANGFRPDDRYALYLKDSGNYRLEPHKDRADEARWANIARAYHDKKSYL